MACESTGFGAPGWQTKGAESAAATLGERVGPLPPDRVESMFVHGRHNDVIPHGVEVYRSATTGYFSEMVRLRQALMRLSACALDLPLDYFDSFFSSAQECSDATLEGACIPDNLLKLAYYPAYGVGESPLDGQLRYGEHTDASAFTILWPDHNSNGPQTAGEGINPPHGGLQVRCADGTWIDCPPVARAFTINLGDMLQRWTNDIFVANVHRVVNPPRGNLDDRLAIAFFSGPITHSQLKCLPTCCGPERPAKYSPITPGEMLAEKVAKATKNIQRAKIPPTMLGGA